MRSSCCGADILWRQFQGMRLFREKNGHNVYDARCSKCGEDLEINATRMSKVDKDEVLRFVEEHGHSTSADVSLHFGCSRGAARSHLTRLYYMKKLVWVSKGVYWRNMSGKRRE